MMEKTLYHFALAIGITLASCVVPISQDAGFQKIQSGCLLFIHDPSERRELWSWCEGEKPQTFLKDVFGIQDYTISADGSELFYSQSNNLRGTDIWRLVVKTKRREKIHTCHEFSCTELNYNSTTGDLAFVEVGQPPSLILLNPQTREMKALPFYAVDLSFSPNGQFLVFWDKNANQIIILDVDGSLVWRADSQEGLIGEWAKDSSYILFSSNNYWGGIPGMNIYSLEMNSGNVELILDSANQQIEYYNPTFFQSNEYMLTAVRGSDIGYARQLWLLNLNGDVKRQITKDYNYDHSAFRLNGDDSKLIYQRFALNQADSQTELWVYDFQSDDFYMIAKNASNPRWFP